MPERPREPSTIIGASSFLGVGDDRLVDRPAHLDRPALGGNACGTRDAGALFGKLLREPGLALVDVRGILNDLEQADGEAARDLGERLPEARDDGLAAGDVGADGLDCGNRVLRAVVAEEDGAARRAHLLLMAYRPTMIIAAMTTTPSAMRRSPSVRDRPEAPALSWASKPVMTSAAATGATTATAMHTAMIRRRSESGR